MNDQARCHFGLCRREAELAITVRDDVTPVLVCGLHVGPLLSWGVPEPAADPTIAYLPSRPEPRRSETWHDECSSGFAS